MSQLFDSLDPSPFFEKDLDPKAEEYIVDSFREFPTRTPAKLVVHLEHAAELSEPEGILGDSIRAHFARQAGRLRRTFRQLLRRGLVSLAIGVGFLAAVFAISQGIGRTPGSSVMELLHQGLLIVGWVAMWRPLEIFLYDWWPIVGECRVYNRLSRIEVRIVRRTPTPPPAGSR